MKLLLLMLATVCMSNVKSEESDDEPHLVSVTRRLSNDFYYYNGSSGAKICDNIQFVNSTYLVDDRLCVAEEELFRRASEGSSAIVPTDLTIVTILDSRTSNMTYLMTADGRALFKFNETDQLVSSSFCNIASLKVFRGWERAIEINHQGFMLSAHGSVQIDKNELAYAIEDYTGELYRMNLDCSNDALPERGSLFFKVLGNSTVTGAKFDCTVPGTLTEFIEECNITTTEETQQATTLPLTTTLIVPTTTDSPSASTGQMSMIYLFVVVGCGVPFLLLFALLVCVIVCLLKRRLRSHKKQTAQVEDQKGGEVQSPVKLDERIYNTLASTNPLSETVLSNGEFENRTYAIPETHRPQSDPNGFHQRSEKNTYTGTPSIAVSDICDEQVQAPNESVHEYEAPLTRKAQDDSNPSEPVYAVLERGTVGTTRSASISGQRSLQQQQPAKESDPSNHHYHVLEQHSFS